MTSQLSYQIESDYFGKVIGSIGIAQLTYGEFQQNCISDIKDNDHTGLRLYSGAHVAIRLLLHFSSLLNDKNVIELGCGVGAFGLIGCSTSTFNNLVLTDGEIKTKELVSVNIERIYSNSILLSKISYSTLTWGYKEAIQTVIADHNNGVPFDVVIGCELMYYRTDIKELLDCVMTLTSCCGIFVHAHIFRRDGQEQELIDYFELHGWVTYEVPHKHFIDEEELKHHPEWYRVRALISGPRGVMEDLRRQGGGFAHLVDFREAPLDDDDDEEDVPETVATIFKV